MMSRPHSAIRRSAFGVQRSAFASLLLLPTVLCLLSSAFAADHKVKDRNTADTDDKANSILETYHDNGDGTFSKTVHVDGTVNITDFSHVTAPPGASPSPSPALAMGVQGIAGATPVSVAQTPKQLTGTPSNFAIGTTDATVFTLAAGEIGFIQNLSADAPLAVKKGASASSSSLNFILAACTADADGTGGAVRIDDWVGVVSVAKMTGTAKYIAWKQAP